MIQDRTIEYAIVIDTKTTIDDYNIACNKGKIGLITGENNYGLTINNTREISAASGETIDTSYLFAGFITKDDIGNSNRSINLDRSGEYGSLASFSFSLKNNTKIWKLLDIWNIKLFNKSIKLYTVIDGLAYQLWAGKIVDVKRAPDKLDIDCEDDSINIHKMLPRDSIENLVKPVVIGDVGYLEATRIEKSNLVVLSNIDGVEYTTTHADYIGYKKKTANKIVGSMDLYDYWLIILRTEGVNFEKDELKGEYLKLSYFKQNKDDTESKNFDTENIVKIISNDVTIKDYYNYYTYTYIYVPYIPGINPPFYDTTISKNEDKYEYFYNTHPWYRYSNEFQLGFSIINMNNTYSVSQSGVDIIEDIAYKYNEKTNTYEETNIKSIDNGDGTITIINYNDVVNGNAANFYTPLSIDLKTINVYPNHEYLSQQNVIDTYTSTTAFTKNKNGIINMLGVSGTYNENTKEIEFYHYITHKTGPSMEDYNQYPFPDELNFDPNPQNTISGGFIKFWSTYQTPKYNINGYGRLSGTFTRQSYIGGGDILTKFNGVLTEDPLIFKNFDYDSTSGVYKFLCEFSTNRVILQSDLGIIGSTPIDQLSIMIPSNYKEVLQDKNNNTYFTISAINGFNSNNGIDGMTFDFYIGINSTILSGDDVYIMPNITIDSINNSNVFLGNDNRNLEIFYNINWFGIDKYGKEITENIAQEDLVYTVIGTDYTSTERTSGISYDFNGLNNEYFTSSTVYNFNHMLDNWYEEIKEASKKDFGFNQFKIPDTLINLIKVGLIDHIKVRVTIRIPRVDNKGGLGYLNYKIKEIGAISKQSVALEDKLYFKYNSTSGTSTYDTNHVYGMFKYILEQNDGISASNIIYNNLPTLRGNTTDWYAGAVFKEQKKSNEYLKQLARQSFVALYPNRKGNRELKCFLDNTTSATINESMTVIDSLKDITETPMRDIYNQFEIIYDKDIANNVYKKKISIIKTDENSFPDKTSNWTDYVTGITSYNLAKSLWDFAHEGYLLSESINSPDITLSNLDFYIDKGVDENSPIEYLKLLIQWNSIQHYKIGFDIPLTEDNLNIELADTIVFHNNLLTDGLGYKGYVDKIVVNPDKNVISLELICEKLADEFIWQPISNSYPFIYDAAEDTNIDRSAYILIERTINSNNIYDSMIVNRNLVED